MIRHPELVSGPISLSTRSSECLASSQLHSSIRKAQWALKQVQGDDGVGVGPSPC